MFMNANAMDNMISSGSVIFLILLLVSMSGNKLAPIPISSISIVVVLVGA